MSSILAGHVERDGWRRPIEREFVRTNTGSQIAVDRILWVKWDDNIEMFLVRLGDEGITTHRVAESELTRLGFTR